MKRKRVTEATKFYSVRVGYRPGIYQSWPECLAQVKGFKGATFKSFSTLTDAERFLAGEDPGKGPTGSRPQKFYAVKSGRVPGIYTDWPSAQKQITGWIKPQHKCFSTRASAQEFLDASDYATAGDEETQQVGDLQTGDLPGTKKSKKGTGAPGNQTKPIKISNDDASSSTDAMFEPSTLDFEDGFDPTVVLGKESGNVVLKTQRQSTATKLCATNPVPGSFLRVYTDGSALGNGQAGAFAGVGVYFGPCDSRNVSEALPGPRQTNQRAELTAIIRALDIVPKDRNAVVVTDSQYSINCVTKWCFVWRENGWKNASGKVVENRDLVEVILAKVDERNRSGIQTQFEWVKGHVNEPGNIEADRLAVDGARRAAQESLHL